MIIEYTCIIGDRATLTLFYDDSTMELYKVAAENQIENVLHIDLLTPPPLKFQLGGHEAGELELPPGQRKHYVMVESEKEPGVFVVGGVDWMAYHEN